MPKRPVSRTAMKLISTSTRHTVWGGSFRFLELTTVSQRPDYTFMNESSSNPQSSRREFIKTTGRIAAVSALAGVTLPQVHAASSDTIQIALIGCGGRGTGAAENALSTKGGTM